MIKSVEELYSYVLPRLKDGIEFTCSLTSSKVRGNSKKKRYRLTFFIYVNNKVLSFGRSSDQKEIDLVIDQYIEEVNALTIKSESE